MSQKKCPACGEMVDSCKGEKAHYLRFECPTHGKFEVHERVADHYVKPGNEAQMRKLSLHIDELRKMAPQSLLDLGVSIENTPIVKVVDRQELLRKREQSQGH